VRRGKLTGKGGDKGQKPVAQEKTGEGTILSLKSYWEVVGKPGSLNGYVD